MLQVTGIELHLRTQLTPLYPGAKDGGIPLHVIYNRLVSEYWSNEESHSPDWLLAAELASWLAILTFFLRFDTYSTWDRDAHQRFSLLQPLHPDLQPLQRLMARLVKYWWLKPLHYHFVKQYLVN